MPTYASTLRALCLAATALLAPQLAHSAPPTTGVARQYAAQQPTDALLSGIADLNARLEQAAAGTGPAESMLAALRERAVLLTELALREPSQAARAALSQRVRAQLSRLDSRADALLETEIEWSGVATPQIEDNFIAGTHETVYRVANAGGSRRVVFGATAPASGATVRVRGLLLDFKVVGLEWTGSAAVAAALPGERRTAAIQAQATFNREIRIAVIMYQTAKYPLGVTRASVEKTFTGATDSVANYYREMSGGKAGTKIDMFGPYTLPAEDNYDNYQRKAAQAAAVDKSGKYDVLVFVQPAALPGFGFEGGVETGSASSTVGPKAFTLVGGDTLMAGLVTIADSALLYTKDKYDLQAAAHEVGHALGLGHANAQFFPKEPLGPVGQTSPVRPKVYGDPDSLMGGGGGHFAAPHKVKLGWFSKGTEYVDVAGDGTFLLKPYADPAGGLQALRVQRGNSALWLQLRRNNPNTLEAGVKESIDGPGVQVLLEDAAAYPDQTETLLLNFDQRYGGLGAFMLMPLLEGHTWNDPYTNLTLEVGKAGTDGIPVKVSYRPQGPAVLSTLAKPLPFTGGDVRIALDAPGSLQWQAATDAAWLQANGANAGTGPGAIAYSAPLSDSAFPRWTVVKAGGAMSVVTQDAMPAALAFVPSAKHFSAEGGSDMLRVWASAEDLLWYCPSGSDWLIMQPTTFENAGSVLMRYSVLPNRTGASRTGTIRILDQTFTVIQDAGTVQSPEIVLEAVSPATLPPKRRQVDVVATANGGLLMYGGDSHSVAAYNGATDTWVWDGTRWQDKTGAANPGSIEGAAMAYDPEHKQVVLFGGVFLNYGVDTVSSATWIWDGNNWTQAKPPASPPGRAFHTMAYNPVTKKIMLFGGRGGVYFPNWQSGTNVPLFDDTWEWDGANWTQAATPRNPPGRTFASMAFDDARQEMVLFGGNRAYAGNYLADTWVWRDGAWQQRSDAGPGARSNARLVYDPSSKTMLLLGGLHALEPDSQGRVWVQANHDMWEWNGSRWQEIFAQRSPQGAASIGAVYDPARNGIMLYLADDWGPYPGVTPLHFVFRRK
ncbi:MAG TPA: hypothetical protein VIT92_00510 [Burkholderiaceae bacterium]